MKGKTVFLFVLLLAGAAAILVWRRDDARRFASGRTVEFIQERVAERVPEEQRDAVLARFQHVRDVLEKGTITPEHVQPLVEMFSTCFEDRRLEEDEVKRILGVLEQFPPPVRNLGTRPGVE